LSGLNAKSGIDVNTNNAPKKGFGWKTVFSKKLQVPKISSFLE
jgi:hypothetical protein